jgi:hypothetical protein
MLAGDEAYYRTHALGLLRDFVGEYGGELGLDKVRAGVQGGSGWV